MQPKPPTQPVVSQVAPAVPVPGAPHARLQTVNSVMFHTWPEEQPVAVKGSQSTGRSPHSL